MNPNNFNKRLINDWMGADRFYSDKLIGDGDKLEQQGGNKALAIFRSAARRVPAYKDFLKKNKIRPDLIRSVKELALVPTTTKENYIETYDLEDRIWDGELFGMHMISTSSGTTGKSHFWPRNLEHELEGAMAHELLFQDILDVGKNRTLLINGFAMGNWIAGTFTLGCASWNAWKGLPLTIMTPGYAMDPIVEILNSFGNTFDQVVICGHTPFLKEVMEKWTEVSGKNNTKIRLLGTGQGVSENWRKYVVGLTQGEGDGKAFINLYGSADAALMGYETPMSIALRQQINNTNDLNRLFGDNRLPSVYNYDPRLTYFQEQDEELVITKNSGCPLVRYNIRDEGGVRKAKEFAQELDTKAQKKLGKFGTWQLPFVYLYGRAKFMVKIYGANIYTEHVQLVVDSHKLQKQVSGRFKLDTEHDMKQNPQLVVRVELAAQVVESQQLIDLVREVFVLEVRRVNSEYNFLLGTLGDKVWPKVVLHSHGDPDHFPKNEIKKTN